VSTTLGPPPDNVEPAGASSRRRFWEGLAAVAVLAALVAVGVWLIASSDDEELVVAAEPTPTTAEPTPTTYLGVPTASTVDPVLTVPAPEEPDVVYGLVPVDMSVDYDAATLPIGPAHYPREGNGFVTTFAARPDQELCVRVTGMRAMPNGGLVAHGTQGKACATIP
jgi:hypothetical protein